MEDLLISTLSLLGFPVKRQGSLLSDEPYPDHFFTFWNNSSVGESFYSNKENAVIWSYTVCFYSVDVKKTYEKLMEAKRLLAALNFTVTGGGFDVVSDEATHTGRGIEVLYREILGR